MLTESGQLRILAPSAVKDGDVDNVYVFNTYDNPFYPLYKATGNLHISRGHIHLSQLSRERGNSPYTFQ